MQDKPKIRISSSVEGFKHRVQDTWGLDEWLGWNDENQNVLFFGLYTKNDYDTFLRHKGKKTIFWCGSDIQNLLGNYDSRRILKLFPETEHWCENEVEAENLRRVGVEAKVCPSFLDDTDNYSLSYKHSKTPHIFLCGHDKREDEYGVDLVKRIAPRLPDTIFHIYGINPNSSYFSTILDPLNKSVVIDVDYPNILYHGKIPEEQFNNEITKYQCGLRPNEHDGFSEVTAKCVLNGGYPITRIKYPNIWNYQTDDELVELIAKLKYMTAPNIEVRSYYLKTINQFPFNQNQKKFYGANKA